MPTDRTAEDRKYRPLPHGQEWFFAQAQAEGAPEAVVLGLEQAESRHRGGMAKYNGLIEDLEEILDQEGDTLALTPRLAEIMDVALTLMHTRRDELNRDLAAALEAWKGRYYGLPDSD